MFHRFFRFFLTVFYKPFLVRYLQKERHWKYRSIQLRIFPGVFHPRFFFSTKLILNYISPLKLKNKNVLELGAGSGLVAIWCAKQNASVTASDISQKAIGNIAVNSKLNNVSLTIINSDLFKSIPRQIFDFIIINPPYYKSTPTTDAEYAWFCGKNGEYFEELFSSIGIFFSPESQILMVLSEDCDLEMIKTKAEKNNFSFIEKMKKTIWFETNYIFLITKK